MKSVGEAMAIGRSFAEALQKGLRSMETGLYGLDEVEAPGDGGHDAFRAALSAPRPDRLLMAAQALRAGLSVEDDPRRLQIRSLVPARARAASSRPSAPSARTACPRDATGMRRLKALGFSDHRLAELQRPRRRRRSTGPGWACTRSTSASTPAPASSPPARPTCIRPIEGGFGSAVLRGRPDRPAQGHHPRRRPEPHRPGHRVRLLLRPRRLRAARGRLRDHHGQLQPGDRQHRLRHLRPAVFRAADRRGRHRAGPQGAGARRACWAASCSMAARRRSSCRRRSRRPASRSSAPRPTRSTSPRTASASRCCCRSSACASRRTASPAPTAEAEAIAERVGYPVVMRPSYVLGGRAMEIVLRPRRAAALHAHLRRGLAGRRPGADRPLPERRHRGRRRLHLRRRRPSTSPA